MIKWSEIQATLNSKSMKNITYRIIDSVTKIKKDDWDLIFGDIPEGYQFYKTLEESGLKDFIFYSSTALGWAIFRTATNLPFSYSIKGYKPVSTASLAI